MIDLRGELIKYSTKLIYLSSLIQGSSYYLGSELKKELQVMRKE
jgi:hypothetical protein